MKMRRMCILLDIFVEPKKCKKEPINQAMIKTGSFRTKTVGIVK